MRIMLHGGLHVHDDVDETPLGGQSTWVTAANWNSVPLGAGAAPTVPAALAARLFTDGSHFRPYGESARHNLNGSIHAHRVITAEQRTDPMPEMRSKSSAH
jgi:hypothetical protein